MRRTTQSRIISAGLLVMLVLLSLASARHFHFCLVRQMTQEQPMADCCTPAPDKTADMSHPGNDCHPSSNNSRDMCDCVVDSQPPVEERQDLDRARQSAREDRLTELTPICFISDHPDSSSFRIIPDFQTGVPPTLETLTCVVLLI